MAQLGTGQGVARTWSWGITVLRSLHSSEMAIALVLFSRGGDMMG